MIRYFPFLTIFLLLLLPVQELLAEVNHKQVQKTACQRLGRMMVHGLAWAICIASTTACAAGIYYFSAYMHQVRRGGFKGESQPFRTIKFCICEYSDVSLYLLSFVTKSLVFIKADINT